MKEADLQTVRDEIDALDQRLVEWLNQRAALAMRAAQAKRVLGHEPPFYRPEREVWILERVRELNQGPLTDAQLVRLFQEIMSACMAREQPLSIACLGPAGTFTQMAAAKHFGQAAGLAFFTTIDQVFREVEAGACCYGVVPVENSIEGAVNQTLDMLLISDLKLCGEVRLDIHQQLLSRAARLEDIARVYSHEQSLAQCRQWLDANLVDARRVPTSSNAEAAMQASEDTEAAAIAGAHAATIYDLPVLRRNIEDRPDNSTRFLILGKEGARPSGRDKTSLLFALQSKPGALLNMLTCFADHGVNMTRIESRPARRGAWEYIFFVDVQGHAQDAEVTQALTELQDKAIMMKLLGSYPVAEVR